MMPTLMLSAIIQDQWGAPQPAGLVHHIQNIVLLRTAPGSFSDLYRAELVVYSGAPRKPEKPSAVSPTIFDFVLTVYHVVQVVVRVLHAAPSGGGIDILSAKKVSPDRDKSPCMYRR
jgi:hypothetical protein